MFTILVEIKLLCIYTEVIEAMGNIEIILTIPK